jgi:hypothetical protein
MTLHEISMSTQAHIKYISSSLSDVILESKSRGCTVHALHYQCNFSVKYVHTNH